MPITNSKDKDLPIPDIITGALADAKRDGDLGDLPMHAAILGIVQEGSMENTDVEKIGNTVFITHYGDGGKHAVMRALNVDTARNYLDNSIEYVKRLASRGVQQMSSDFKDKRILQLFKSIANRPEFSHWGMKVLRAEDGTMRAYVALKGA